MLNVGQFLVRICEEGLVQLWCRLLQHFGRFGRGPQIIRGARGVPAAVVRRDPIEAVLQIGPGAPRQDLAPGGIDCVGVGLLAAVPEDRRLFARQVVVGAGCDLPRFLDLVGVERHFGERCLDVGGIDLAIERDRLIERLARVFCRAPKKPNSPALPMLASAVR